MPTPDGAFVVGEPQGAPGWFPANDNPRDKARTTSRSRSHGGTSRSATACCPALRPRRPHDLAVAGESPMATYLATATNGRSTSRARAGRAACRSTTPWTAGSGAPDGRGATSRASRSPHVPHRAHGRTRSRRRGRSSTTRPRRVRARVPDQAQLRPRAGCRDGRARLAHQWVGDSVTLKVWPDLAARGLRDVLDVAVGRARRRADGEASSTTCQRGWDWSQSAIPPTAAVMFTAPRTTGGR